MDAVIVTHNSAADLRALVASEETIDAFERLIVVDNGSGDETARVALEAGLELVACANEGFAAAVNRGATLVRGPLFALLNPDVRLGSTADLGALARHFEAPEVGAVAPALILPDGSLQDSARVVPSPVDLIVRRFTGRRPDVVRSSSPVDVEWAVGAFLLLRRTAFDSLGGFDPRYFLYFEDVDFGVRLAGAGFRLRYDPTVRVFHDHRAASRSSLTGPATRHHMRSAARFYAANPNRLLRRGRRLSGAQRPAG